MKKETVNTLLELNDLLRQLRLSQDLISNNDCVFKINNKNKLPISLINKINSEIDRCKNTIYYMIGDEIDNTQDQIDNL